MTTRQALPLYHTSVSSLRVRDFLDVRLSANAAYWRSVEEFESAYGSAHGAAEAVLVPTGRDGLRFILEFLRTPGRTRVVVPALGDSSIMEMVLDAGLVPVSAPVRPSDGTLDLGRVEPLLDRHVLAVIPVHLFGRACQVERLAEMTSRQGIQLVEDCAHAPLTQHQGRWLGTFGIASFTSFAPFKLIDCGGGGMVLTNDRRLAAAVRAVARRHVPIGLGSLASRSLASVALSLGTSRMPYDLVGHPLYLRMGSGGRAVRFYEDRVRPLLKHGADEGVRGLPALPFVRSGLRQLIGLASRIGNQRRLAGLLRRGLPLGLLLEGDAGSGSSEYAQVASFADRDRAMQVLVRRGIDAVPNPAEAWGECPVARRLQREGVLLPWFDKMADQDVDLLRKALVEAAGTIGHGPGAAFD